MAFEVEKPLLKKIKWFGCCKSLCHHLVFT